MSSCQVGVGGRWRGGESRGGCSSKASVCEREKEKPTAEANTGKGTVPKNPAEESKRVAWTESPDLAVIRELKKKVKNLSFDTKSFENIIRKVVNATYCTTSGRLCYWFIEARVVKERIASYQRRFIRFGGTGWTRKLTLNVPATPQ